MSTGFNATHFVLVKTERVHCVIDDGDGDGGGGGGQKRAASRQMHVGNANRKKPSKNCTKQNRTFCGLWTIPSVPSNVGKSFDTSYSKATLLRLLISYVKPTWIEMDVRLVEDL